MLTSRRKSDWSGVLVPKKRSRPERDVQVAVVKWLRNRGGRWLTERIENAEGTAAKVAEAKRMGAEAGSPDLLLTYKDWPPFRLELKSLTGTTSNVQKSLHEQLRLRGQFVMIAKGYDSAIEQLEEYEREKDEAEERNSHDL